MRSRRWSVESDVLTSDFRGYPRSYHVPSRQCHMRSFEFYLITPACHSTCREVLKRASQFSRSLPSFFKLLLFQDASFFFVIAAAQHWSAYDLSGNFSTSYKFKLQRCIVLQNRPAALVPARRYCRAYRSSLSSSFFPSFFHPLLSAAQFIL